MHEELNEDSTNIIELIEKSYKVMCKNTGHFVHVQALIFNKPLLTVDICRFNCENHLKSRH